MVWASIARQDKDNQQASAFFYLAKALRVGGGGSVCLMARHSTAFNSSSSTMSASEKSMRADSSLPEPFAGLLSVIEIFGGMAV